MIRLKSKVIVTGVYDSNTSIVNKKGRVIGHKNGDTLYLIEFNEEIVSGHNGQGDGEYGGKQGHCWWVRKDLVKLLGKEKPLSTKEKFEDLCSYL